MSSHFLDWKLQEIYCPEQFDLFSIIIIKKRNTHIHTILWITNGKQLKTSLLCSTNRQKKKYQSGINNWNKKELQNVSNEGEVKYLWFIYSDYVMFCDCVKKALLKIMNRERTIEIHDTNNLFTSLNVQH